MFLSTGVVLDRGPIVLRKWFTRSRDMTTKTAVVKSVDEPADDPLENMLLFFNLSIRKLAFVGVSLPLITLLTCLATAYVFQYDDVHETHCRVSIFL